LGTETTVDHLKQAGTTNSARERLNIVVNTGAGWLAQVFSTHPDLSSGPAAFLVFTLIRALLMSCSQTVCSSLSMELTSATVPLTVLLLVLKQA